MIVAFGGETFCELSKPTACSSGSTRLSVCVLADCMPGLSSSSEKGGRVSHESLTALALRGGREPAVLALLDGCVVRAASVRAERWGRRAATEISAGCSPASPSPVSQRSTGGGDSVAKSEEPKSPSTRQCGHHGYCGPPGGACGQAERGYEAFEAEARVSDEKETGGC